MLSILKSIIQKSFIEDEIPHYRVGSGQCNGRNQL